MTESEKYDICALCKSRRTNLQTGFYCALDGEKPHFEDFCPNYEYDQERAEELNNRPVLPKREAEIGGFLSFYLFVAGIGGVGSLIAQLTSINLSVDYAGSKILAAADILLILLYAGVCFYTIYAFVKRRPNAVGLAIIQLSMLVLMNGLNLIVGDTDGAFKIGSTGQLVVSLIWSVVFFVYLLTSERVKDLIPKEKRRLYKADKIVIFGLLGVVLILFFLGILDVAGVNPFADKRTQLERLVTAADAQLPVDTGNGVTYESITLEDDAIVQTFQSDFRLVNLFGEEDEGNKKEMGLMAKERILYGLYTDKGDEVFATFVPDGYSMVYRLMDSADEIVFDFTISPEEYMEAYESTDTYSTREDVLDAIMELFNAGLPKDFLEDAWLTSVEKDMGGGGLVFNLAVTPSTVSSLGDRFEKTFHNRIKDNFSKGGNEMVELAYMNDWDMTFRLSDAGPSKWITSLRFTPAEYKRLVDF